MMRAIGESLISAQYDEEDYHPHRSASDSNMAEHRFVIGRDEKHSILVKHSAWTAETTIYVDGVHKSSVYRGAAPTTVSLVVGQTEWHKLTLIISGIARSHLEAYVNGDRVYKS